MSEENEIAKFLESISSPSSAPSPTPQVIRRPLLLGAWTLLIMAGTFLQALLSIIAIVNGNGLGFVYVVLAVVTFSIAYSLYRGEAGGWRAAHWYVALRVMFDILLLISGTGRGEGQGEPVVRIVVGVLFIFYIHTKDVKRFCRLYRRKNGPDNVDVMASIKSL